MVVTNRFSAENCHITQTKHDGRAVLFTVAEILVNVTTGKKEYDQHYSKPSWLAPRLSSDMHKRIYYRENRITNTKDTEVLTIQLLKMVKI